MHDGPAAGAGTSNAARGRASAAPAPGLNLGALWPRRGVARDAAAGAYLETLLVAAVTSLLVTRFYLELTGFPRVGGGELHIAHVLWGGLLMLAALALLVTLLGSRVRRLAAIVGGIGFGLFIDELGKFVTADTDYFFRPAIALIYVVFIALFLAFRAVERRSLTRRERLANAASLVTDMALAHASRAEHALALALLETSDAHSPLAEAIRAAIVASASARDPAPSLLARCGARLRGLGAPLLASAAFQRAFVVVFVAQAGAGVLVALSAALGWPVAVRAVGAAPARVALASAVLALGLTLVGTIRLRRSRRSAYRWYEHAVLVGIYVTQVVLFFAFQLVALVGLAWSLALLTALRLLLAADAGAPAR